MRLLQVLVLFLCANFSSPLFAQKSTKEIRKDLRFSANSSANRLIVQNINGPISIEGYQGKTIVVNATKSISGDKQTKGMEEVKLKFAEKGDEVFVYVETPRNIYDLDKEKYKDWGSSAHNYEHPGYDHYLAIQIKVPASSNLKVKTMNNGDIEIRNVQAKDLHVNNLNGAISMENVAGKTYVNALNRDINITYASNPREESYYKSLNGDVRILLAKEIDADVSFKSLNGDFYTDMEAQMIPQQMSKTSENGTKFKLSKNERFRLGNGGVKLHFDLLNGDVMLKH